VAVVGDKPIHYLTEQRAIPFGSLIGFFATAQPSAASGLNLRLEKLMSFLGMFSL
jgi:hypothetical protein